MSKWRIELWKLEKAYRLAKINDRRFVKSLKELASSKGLVRQ